MGLFPVHLLAPRDPGFGVRIVPGWGHEGVDNQFALLITALVARGVDQAISDALVWGWDQCGRPIRGHHDAGFSPRVQMVAGLWDKPSADSVPPQLASSWLPGFGATMRAHAGDPNETYLSLRNGYLCSHRDANQGDFVIHAKGSPLVAQSLIGYAHHGGEYNELYKSFGWHQRPRFASQGNDGGWPGGGAAGGIPAHAFNHSTDYLRAIGDYGPNRWTRQIALLKSNSAAGPNYFVLRDSFDAAGGDPSKREQKWWYLRTPGGKGHLAAGHNQLNYDSPYGAKLTAHFLQPASVAGAVESRDATRTAGIHFENARTWCAAGSPVKHSEHQDNITIEETMTVTAVGPLAPDQDVLVVLYPRGQEEPPPTYESLGDGAVKIVTSESVDYVLLDRKPMKFAAGDVTFEGTAGAVRVFPHEVHLVISEGPATISYQGTRLSSATSAIRIIPASDLGKKLAFDVPARESKLKNTRLPQGYRVAGDASCELTVENDRLIGKSEGAGGFFYAPMPAGLKVLPMLVVDGKTYAAGTAGNELIIPLLPGEHDFEIRALEQPPIFRHWQAWD